MIKVFFLKFGTILLSEKVHVIEVAGFFVVFFFRKNSIFLKTGYGDIEDSRCQIFS